jgi:Glycosyl transferase family 2
VSSRPSVSVVLAQGYQGPVGSGTVPERNGDRVSRLDLVLTSLRRQTIGVERFEVILPDDGSPELAALVGRHRGEMNVRVVPGRHVGLAGALNLCIAEAASEIVLFGTDRAVLGAASLDGHAAAHEASPTGTPLVACGRQYVLPHAALFRDITIDLIDPGDVAVFGAHHGDWVYRALDLMALDEQIITTADVAGNFRKLELLAAQTPDQRDVADTLTRDGGAPTGCPWLVMRYGNHSVRRDLLDRAGHLDEALDEHGGFCLDLDLGLRMWRAGARFVPVDSAISYDVAGDRDPEYHPGRASGFGYLLGKYRCAEVALLPEYLSGIAGAGLTVAGYGQQVAAARRWFDHLGGLPVCQLP